MLGLHCNNVNEQVQIAHVGSMLSTLHTFRVDEFDIQTCPVPSSSDEFIRTWKRKCIRSESKLGLLQKCGAVKLQSIFKVNLPAELLSNFLLVLDSAPPPEAMQACEACTADQHQLSAAHTSHLSNTSSNAQLIFDILQALSGEPQTMISRSCRVHCLLHGNIRLTGSVCLL